MSQETFSDTLIRLEAFKIILNILLQASNRIQILYFLKKSTFFQGVSTRFFVKNDQILKLAFFTCLRP